MFRFRVFIVCVFTLVYSQPIPVMGNSNIGVVDSLYQIFNPVIQENFNDYVLGYPPTLEQPLSLPESVFLASSGIFLIGFGAITSATPAGPFFSPLMVTPGMAIFAVGGNSIARYGEIFDMHYRLISQTMEQPDLNDSCLVSLSETEIENIFDVQISSCFLLYPSYKNGIIVSGQVSLR